ncbi:MAG TPA: hypothetical protein DIW07_08885 [Lachnospiraceae bacterium]|nr:hypothetical protein [Lachnospiraceae bacterium]
MKKIMMFLLTCTFIFSFSAGVFANDKAGYSTEPRITSDGEVIPGLIPLPDDYPVPADVSERSIQQPDGWYINGDGVAARRPYGLSAPVIGRLYTGDIVWSNGETKRADGYTWLHVDTDRNSNMGAVPDVWIVIDYIGEPWRVAN